MTMMGGCHLVVMSSLFMLVIPSTDGASCAFPADLTGDWWSSKKGEVTFTSTTLSNYNPCRKPEDCTGVTSTWTCLESSGNKYLIRSDPFEDPGTGATAYVYACLYMYRLSNTKYLAYQGPKAERQQPYNDYVIPSRRLTYTLSDLCDLDENALPASRHNLFIRNDSTLAAETTCPADLLGNYMTDNTGQCNVTVDVCTDRKRVAVDTMGCDDDNDTSDNLLFTGNGTLSCVYSLQERATTYVTLYSIDDGRNDSLTVTFTCISVTLNESTVLIRQAPNECYKMNETVREYQLEPNYLCPIGCDFSENLLGLWTSNRKGDLVISQSSIAGLPPYGPDCLTSECTTQPTAYECYLAKGSRYLVRSARTNLLDKSVRIYLCLDFTSVTKTKIVYYQAHAAKDPVLLDYLTTRNAALSVESIDDICTVDSPNDAALYSILLNTADLTAGVQDCPSEFEAIYNTTDTRCDYTLTTCEHKTTIKLSDTSCPSRPFYSAQGEMSCVYTTNAGSTTYLTLINNDVTVDGNNTYKFTCIAFTGSDKLLAFTQSPRGCYEGQAPDDANTTTFVYTHLDSCPVPEEFNWIIVVAVIAGVIALIIIALLAWYFCCRRRCRVCRKQESKSRDKVRIVGRDDRNNGESGYGNGGGSGSGSGSLKEGRGQPGERDKKNSPFKILVDNFTLDEEVYKTRLKDKTKGEGGQTERSGEDGEENEDKEEGSVEMDGHNEKEQEGNNENESVSHLEDKIQPVRDGQGKAKKRRRKRRKRKRKMKTVSKTLEDGTVVEEELSTDWTDTEEASHDAESDNETTDVSHSDDVTSDGDSYSEDDVSDVSQDSETRVKMMIDAKYNQRLAKSWESRRNNPDLVQDKTKPKRRHDFEEKDMKRLNALAAGIPASKVELIKEVFDKAGWQRKNRVHKDRDEMMALSGTKINIHQQKGKTRSPWNHPGNKSSALNPGNLGRAGLDPAGHPSLLEIPFMAEYYSYTQARQQLDDEGFWDAQDGHFQTSEEQFRFSDLENELLKEEDIKYGLKNEPSVEQEAALAVENGRRKSTKRVVISSKPPISTTISREDDCDTGIDTQSQAGSLDDRQDEEVTNVQETDHQVVAPTPSNTDPMSRFYARLQELHETNDDDIEANNSVPDVDKRTRVRNEHRRIKTALRRLLTERLISDPNKWRSKKASVQNEVNGRHIDATYSNTNLSKNGLGSGQSKQGPGTDRLKVTSTNGNKPGKIVLTDLKITGSPVGQQCDPDIQGLEHKTQEKGNNAPDTRHPLRPIQKDRMARKYSQAMSQRLKPIPSHNERLSGGLKTDQAFLQRIQGDQAAGGKPNKANPSAFWSNNLSQQFSEHRSPADLRFIDDLELRRLLEELYKDKKYMDKLITTAEDDVTEKEVCRSLEQGRDYLIQRACFWLERGPLPPPPPLTAFSSKGQNVRVADKNPAQIDSSTTGAREKKSEVLKAQPPPGNSQSNGTNNTSSNVNGNPEVKISNAQWQTQESRDISFGQQPDHASPTDDLVPNGIHPGIQS